MDGYAVRAVDCSQSAVLPIIDYIPAGTCAKKPLEPATAIKIMTGAPIPEGCDSVVPLEDAEESDKTVRIRKPVTPRQHVRFSGEDIREGNIVFRKGTVIRPVDINVLATFGKAFVPVFRSAKVAIVATGDELLNLGETPSEGKIINSNSYSLAAAVKQLGATPMMLGICRDNLESHRQKLREGLDADVLITSAGVSVGDRDLVRAVLAELGVEQIFWRVNVKPGKALAFGMRDTKPVFALPGNPVSAMLTFEEFVAPAVLKMMGHTRFIGPLITAELQHEITKTVGRTHLTRVQVEYANGKYLAWSAGQQDTGLVSTLLMANAIAVLPAERATFSAGDQIQVHFFDIHSQLRAAVSEVRP
jgi:molybdopterin molybdotransferase